jgi:hypothetical protein
MRQGVFYKRKKMTIIYAVILFGVFAIIGLTVFGILKLNDFWNNVLLFVNKDGIESCKNDTQCKILKEMNTDFLERRNEFWSIFGQYIITLFIITILAVLLIMKKVSPEAALPIMAGLASFAAGKGIASAKHDKLPKKQLENKQKE